MKLVTTSIIFAVCSTAFSLQAQNYKFGKVSHEELEEKFYAPDSAAHATILYKNRYSRFDYFQDQGWQLITTVHERIKLYDKAGFKWATKAFKLYSDVKREKASIKAFTYNLVNGKVTKTKLSNKAIFDENINKYWNQKKFTMPDLKEGSIVEWEYTITSPFFWKIDNLELQSFIPINRIETKVSIPEYFVFNNVSKGYLPFNFTNSIKRSNILLRDGQKIEFNSNITECIAHKVPALKDEPYVNNISNYLSSINYELTSTQFPNSKIEYYTRTWDDVSKTINESDSFGGQLEKNGHFKDELLQVVNATAPSLERISKVFNFVKSKIKWNDFTGIYANEGVRKAYKQGVGNVADINLNLVAMLREVGLNANPVLTSTRDHGIPLFPTTDGFNYVIAAVELPQGMVLLDATSPHSVPNILPQRTINWQGRLVRKDGSSKNIDLFPKKHSATKTLMSVKFVDNEINGLDRTSYSNHHALTLRNTYLGVGKTDLIAVFEKNHGIEIEDIKMLNEHNLNKSIVINMMFNSDQYLEEIGDKLYFSSLLYLTKNKNPFTLEDRQFPVDFGTPWQEDYSVSIELPEGYEVTSKPADMAIGLPDNLGVYKYKIVRNGNKLKIFSKLTINSAQIPQNYYAALKDFYQQIVDKQVEKIVLSKI
ncbi:DUF3857 domain-containing protein [Flavobacteriaceae bacterium F08102]|nr:DUF3857 domain-containing protein [Flavobacteriaceae bacterium F08102]